MARVSIDLPEAFRFRTEIPVRVSDINYGGHLGNDAVLSIAQEARARFLASLGLSELDVGGAGIMMIDASVMYRSEGTYGMVLAVDLSPEDVRTRGVDLVYRLADVATGREVARVRTGLVFFDRTAGRLVSMPRALRDALAAGPPAST